MSVGESEGKDGMVSKEGSRTLTNRGNGRERESDGVREVKGRDSCNTLGGTRGEGEGKGWRGGEGGGEGEGEADAGREWKKKDRFRKIDDR